MSFIYDVIAPGFHDAKLHHPEGKRRTVTVEKKFKKCPSWLKLRKQLTAAELKAAEKAAAEAAEKAEQEQEEQKTEIASVDFGEAPKPSQGEGAVETL